MTIPVIGGTPGTTSALSELKDYLRITDTAQDAHLTTLLSRATAKVTGYLGTLIVAAEVTETVQVGRNETYLALRNWPVSTTATITIDDPDGNDYSADALLLMPDSAMLVTGSRYGSRGILAPGAWTVTYTGGLSLRGDYAAVVAPNIALATMLYAADLYSNRNPRATAERDGDVSVTLGAPDYFADLLAPYRKPV